MLPIIFQKTGVVMPIHPDMHCSWQAVNTKDGYILRPITLLVPLKVVLKITSPMVFIRMIMAKPFV